MQYILLDFTENTATSWSHKHKSIATTVFDNRYRKDHDVHLLLVTSNNEILQDQFYHQGRLIVEDETFFEILPKYTKPACFA